MLVFLVISAIFALLYKRVIKNDLVNVVLTTGSVSLLSFLNYYITDSLIGMWPIAIVVQAGVALISAITTLLILAAFSKLRGNKNT